MSFVFPPADPQPPRGGSLFFELEQFFYVVTFKKAGKKFKGAVVLFPGLNHDAEITFGKWNGKPLSGAQIDVFRAAANATPTAMSANPKETKGPDWANLAKSEDLFQKRIKMKPFLVSGKPVPSDLDVRVVLSDGELHERDPRRGANAEKAIWDFSLGGKKVKSRKMTDRVEYELSLDEGFRYWLVLSDGQKIADAVELKPGPNRAHLINNDHDEHERLDPGQYVLHSCRMLHEAVLDVGDPGHMEGFYDGDNPLTPIKGSAEPICGGEQGDPDPPEDPPDPPNP